MTSTICFIGCGNMAQAMIRGLLATGWPSTQIIATAREQKKLQAIAKSLSINTSTVNSAALNGAEYVVLAVKPPQLLAVLAEIKNSLSPQQVILSVVTGVNCTLLEQFLKPTTPVVAAMPNTPALVGEGITGLIEKNLSPDQSQAVELIFQSLGTIQWLENEAQLPVITAVTGSAPAYYLLLGEYWCQASGKSVAAYLQELRSRENPIITAMMDAHRQAAEALGLQGCASLVEQVVKGVACLIQAEQAPLSQLRDNVTSKGGTTAAALDVLTVGPLQQWVEDQVSGVQSTISLTKLMYQGIVAANKRAEVISSSLFAQKKRSE